MPFSAQHNAPHAILHVQRAVRPGQGGAAGGAAPYGTPQLRLCLPRPARQERDAAGAVECSRGRSDNLLLRLLVARPVSPVPACTLQVGLVHSTRLGEDDSKSLKQLNFQTGDFLSVAMF